MGVLPLHVVLTELTLGVASSLDDGEVLTLHQAFSYNLVQPGGDECLGSWPLVAWGEMRPRFFSGCLAGIDGLLSRIFLSC